MIKQLVSDVSSLGIKKKILYQTFRKGGDGYWADVPPQYVLQLPPGTLLLLENEQVFRLTEIVGQKLIAVSQEKPPRETVLNASKLASPLKCFLFKKPVKPKPFISSLESGIGIAAVCLALFPALLLLLLADFKTILPLAYLPIALSLVLILLLGSSFHSKSLITGFFCKSGSSSNCANISSINPFKFTLFHPSVMGSTYACANLILLLHFEHEVFLLGIQLLAILANGYVFIFRLKRNINCRLCDTIAILVLLTASAIIYYLNS